MTAQNTITIEINPTVFAKHNEKNKLAADHETTSISVKRLKHGHLRTMQQKRSEDQIHFLMTQLTDLSPSDLDELDIEDSAKLTEVIYGFMQSYTDIAKKMVQE